MKIEQSQSNIEKYSHKKNNSYYDDNTNNNNKNRRDKLQQKLSL